MRFAKGVFFLQAQTAPLAGRTTAARGARCRAHWATYPPCATATAPASRGAACALAGRVFRAVRCFQFCSAHFSINVE